MRPRGGALGDDPYPQMITDTHGADAAAIPLVKADAEAIARRIGDELDSLPPRNRLVVSLLTATRVRSNATVIARMLDQFNPVDADDDELATSLLFELHERAGDPVVDACLARWAGHPGEPGDHARAALAIPRYRTPEWDDRERSWRTIDDVAADAAAAVPLGWPRAAPIRVLEALLSRERARAQGEEDEFTEWLEERGVRVEPFEVTDALLTRIARQAFDAAEDDIASIAPLSAILAMTATAETVPLLREALRRNEARRTGFEAEVTRDEVLDALRPFQGTASRERG